MAFFPVFLSVVYVVRNQGLQLESIIHSASEKLSSLVTDYELIIVDNASDDESINVLKNLTGQAGYPKKGGGEKLCRIVEITFPTVSSTLCSLGGGAQIGPG